MSGTQDYHAVANEACDRCFSIPELVRMFLDECTAQVLLNCTLVCNDCNEIITGTDSLQEQLFLNPARSLDGVRRKLDPMLRTHFAPILYLSLQQRKAFTRDARNDIETGLSCVYSDIDLLSWAQDPSLEAPMRCAFTRGEASWHRMLVSQPPLKRIDWWHEWLYDENITNDDALEASKRGFDEREVEADGWGHQDLDREFVTLGMLWDLVESRLARGCLVRVYYFLDGKAVNDDRFATEAEWRHIAKNERGQRPYAPSTPRVKISTQQISNNIPWSNAGFDMRKRLWIDMPQKRSRITYGDGFNALRADCYQDWENEHCRFSQSDGFHYAELMGESSGMVGRDEP